MMLEINTEQANCLQRAIKYWLGSAERKRDAVRLMQVEAEDLQRELTKSEAADVEYVNKRLPQNVDNLEFVLKQIIEKAGT
jgi:CCR4-NOT transcriptional regulation complex NOT5 subunit